ncbi:MAG: hypothetical protein AAF593_00170 [Planctomycetota bacterium]
MTLGVPVIAGVMGVVTARIQASATASAVTKQSEAQVSQAESDAIARATRQEYEVLRGIIAGLQGEIGRLQEVSDKQGAELERLTNENVALKKKLRQRESEIEELQRQLRSVQTDLSRTTKGPA